MGSDFKVEGENIDAAYLEDEVSRRVEERRDTGVYSGQVEALLSERLPDEEYREGLPPLAGLDYAATRALSAWEVTAAYPVATEKRFLRPLVIFLKRIARLWARVAVGPIQREQSTFNRHVAQALDALRGQATMERADELAAEEDLCRLVESFIDDSECRKIAAACMSGIGKVDLVTVLGPCPGGLVMELIDNGYRVLRVSPASSWDRPADTRRAMQGPARFLEQLPEESVAALLLPEIAFWLRPEALVRLVRRSYLALAPGGPLAIAVHSFAAGAPAPAWCDTRVVKRALELAGFSEVSILEELREPGAGPSGYVAVARK